MSEIVWGKEMTDEEFVEASAEYFGKRFWDLHVGCCLIVKIDPKSKLDKVGTNYLEWTENDDDEEYDYTKRPFLIALRAISAAENNFSGIYKTVPLPSERQSAKIQTGKDVVVDTRIFVKWVTEQWPDNCRYFKRAEDAYNQRKESKKSKSDIFSKSARRRAEAKAEFLEMIKEEGGAHKNTERALTARLWSRLKELDEKPYSPDTLRPMIRMWKKLM